MISWLTLYQRNTARVNYEFVSKPTSHSRYIQSNLELYCKVLLEVTTWQLL